VTGPDVAVLISTHDRHHDARINMEIVREVWSRCLDPVVLVQAHNGPRRWCRHLEDRTVVVSPGPSHYTGAAQLIDAGSAVIAEEYPDVRYVVYLASDTWLYRPEGLAEILDDMRAGDLRLAAASFEVSDTAHGVRRERGDPALLPGSGLTTDFFVADLPWSLRYRLLPLDLVGFVDEFGDLLAYFQEIVLLEKLVEGRYLAAVRRYLRDVGWRKDGLGSEGMRQGRALLRLLHERPIDPAGQAAPSHKGHWPELGLITLEEPSAKQAALRAVPGLRGGPLLARFLGDDDLTWFDTPDVP
jgi:hypothetical protein